MEKITKKRIGAAIVALGMATSIYFAPHIVNAQNNTGAELSSDRSFAAYLEEIEEEKNIKFANDELYTILCQQLGTHLTKAKIQSVSELIIETPLNNQNLSDLKYLTNLESLQITGMNINCSDLKYNQNLSTISFFESTISNTTDLPNTIKNIVLYNTSFDESFITPYNTTYMYVSGTSLNKIQFKNPEGLKDFIFSGYGFLNLEDLRDCNNLNLLQIEIAPNIRHPEYINKINTKTLKLDEFCTLWIGNNVIRDLPIDNESKDKFMSINNQLSDIVDKIITSDMDEEEKINQIILYVLNQIEYDNNAIGETEAASKLCTEYNIHPLSHALEDNDGVCVAYATLFTALANRVGITSYQPDSIDHTWNMVKTKEDTEYRGYDLTMLDHTYTVLDEYDGPVYDQNNPASAYIAVGDTERLHYYDFDLSIQASESYQTNIEAKNIEPASIETGYIHQTPSYSKRDILELRLKLALIELIILSSVTLLSAISKKDSKPQYQTRTIPLEEKTKKLEYQPRRQYSSRTDNKQIVMGKRK